MEILLVLVVVAVAVWLIVGPLRSDAATPAVPPKQTDRAELEAAKEAKYREIRDAELDYRTGKLSQEDWKRVDAELRAEAIELLRRLDAAGVDSETAS
jgi:hypothetical protein